MLDPEVELELNVKARKYVDELISKLNRAEKYKSALGKDYQKIQELISILEIKENKITKKIDRLSNEIVEMTEIIADVTEADFY